MEETGEAGILQNQRKHSSPGFSPVLEQADQQQQKHH
jgi:hypothetical protein